jgi:hypothetical protein
LLLHSSFRTGCFIKLLPSTKTFVLGKSTAAAVLVLITFVKVLLVETVPFKSDAVQKLHQNFVSFLGKSIIIGLSEDRKTSIK